VEGLEASFQKVWPGKTPVLRNLSSRAQSVAQMAARIKTEVIPARPDLVIWQTGTVDAARHIDTNAFAATLSEGLDQLRRARIDVVLIGPQRRSRLASIIDVEPHQDIMAQIADRESVPFLSRFDIMTYWEENEVFDLGAADQAVQIREASAQSRCLLLLLIEQIHHAVRLSP
jgi:cellobiose-specific phosphotransferase system component IIB